MAYTSGGEIREWDYNILAWAGNTSGTYDENTNNLALVWGVGTGQKGYGQDVSAFPVVTTGSLVTAASWSGLVYHVNKALAHQSQTQLANGSNIGIVTGETVTSFANVVTGITQINTTNLTHHAVGTKTTGSNLDDSLSSTSGLSIATNYDVTVTFASADQARYFFNAGGELQYRMSSVSGGGSGSEQSVDRLITDTTSAYTASNANINVYYAGATDRGAKGNVVRFRINLAVANKTWDDTISMTLRHRVDIQYPSTTYLAAVSGTPVVALA